MKKRLILSNEMIDALEQFRKNRETGKDEAMRAQAILLLCEEASDGLIRRITGLSYHHVFCLRKKFFKNGTRALLSRKKATRALLTATQLKEIGKVLTSETPRAYGCPAGGWTIGVLARLIKERYRVEYKSKTSFYLLFRKFQLTYHKPDKQYKNRNEETIKMWIETKVPEIELHLKEKNTVVLLTDEMILTTKTTTQRIWLPIGHFPKIEESSDRKRRGIYGFLDIKTGQEYAFKADGLNSKETCAILDKLGKKFVGKKIVLIWDNASWHRSKELRMFLKNTKHNFWLIALPPYAPELNPQEHVWKEGRHQITHNVFIKNIDAITDKLVEFFNTTIFGYKFMNLNYV